MHILRIEHPVPAFDDDPIGRKAMGVRRCRVLRPVDDPNYALVDLEFDSKKEAEMFLSSLRKLWGRVEGGVMRDPRARILSVVDDREP